MEIIAEIGSNYHIREDCLASIKKAKLAGADVAKFQLFTHEELYGFPQPAGSPDGGQYLPRDIIPDLKAFADRCEIEFMCTPFSVDGIDFLDPYVRRFKVASSNLLHYEMLERLNEIKKPVILSTGGHYISQAVVAAGMLKDCDVTVMYCVADYPARYINFFKMLKLMEHFPKVGYSDHSEDILNIPMMAKTYGAVILEKHVNFTNWNDTPDAPHSLSGDEFKLMVNNLKGREVPIEFGEDKMRSHWKVRCIAIKGIECGEKLEYGTNFGIFRSKRLDIFGLNPLEADLLNGKQTNRAYCRGDGIGLNGVE